MLPQILSCDPLAEIICADENENLFGVLCTLVSATPALFAILNNNLFINFGDFQGIPGFNQGVLQVQFQNFPQPVVPNLQFPNNFRNLQFGNAQQYQNVDLQFQNVDQLLQRGRAELTLFAATNSALARLLNRPLNSVFDQTDDEVVDFFDEIGLDVTDDDVLLSEYLLTNAGRISLNQILLTHILNLEAESDDLSCNQIYPTLSGQRTQTLCRQVSPPLTTAARFQIGAGNTGADRPLLYATNTPASNGILHVVDEVILPRLTIPDPFFWVPINPATIIIINPALVIIGQVIINTQEPSAAPTESLEPSGTPSGTPSRTPTV